MNKERKVKCEVISVSPYSMTITIDTYGDLELGHDFAMKVADAIKTHAEEHGNTSEVVDMGVEPSNEDMTPEEIGVAEGLIERLSNFMTSIKHENVVDIRDNTNEFLKYSADNGLIDRENCKDEFQIFCLANGYDMEDFDSIADAQEEFNKLFINDQKAK